MKGFFLRLPSCSQLLRIHFPEILQMKVLQTLMTDLLALLGFAGLLTVLLIFLTSSLEDIRRWVETQYIFLSWLISFFHLSLWRWIRSTSSPQPSSIQFCILHPLDHLSCMPFESSFLPHTKHLSCFSLYRLWPSYFSSLVWVALTSFVLVTSPSLNTSRKSADTIALHPSALPEFAFIPFTRSFALSQPGSSWLSLSLICCIYLCLICLPSILTRYSLPVSSLLLLAPVHYAHDAPVEPSSPLLSQSCCTFRELLFGLLLIQPVSQ